MKDPYETLGVERSATDNEIKEAFKKLARKFHPDLHPDDKEAEAKFKDISAANDLLKDKEKRRRFDAGEIDASGAERPQERFYRDFADGPAYASHAAQDGFNNNEELNDLLSGVLRSGGRSVAGHISSTRPGCRADELLRLASSTLLTAPYERSRSQKAKRYR